MIVRGVRSPERRQAGGPAPLGALASLAAAVVLSAAPAGAEAGFIEPGPARMSPEETALQADPANGVEHAVILFVEAKRKEDDPTALKHAFHLRAKILSNEARDLGDIEIPYSVRVWDLKEWWGRVIQPDGTVRELDREDLAEHEISRSRGRKLVVRKGALPGIVPGSVIDYGYVLQQDRARYVSPWWRIRLQWTWPVRELRYTWTPYEYLPSGFVATRASHLDVETKRFLNQVRVVGRNLTPVKEEPYMPPEDSVRASVWFFYFDKDEEYKDFWNDKARIVDRRAAGFMDDDKVVASLMETAGLTGSEPLEEKLRRAYDWIVANVKVDEDAYDEGLATLRGDYVSKKSKTVEDIVEDGRGAGVHRLLLMMGLARALGAEAHIVLATDRSDHFWNKAVWTMSQFDEAMVAVSAPGEPESEATLLAPHLDLPYGKIPWWVTAGTALMATSQGARAITPPASPAEENTSSSEVTVTLDLAGEPARVAWSRTGTGQHAIQQDLLVNHGTGEDVSRNLERACGKSSRFELEASRSLATEADRKGPRMECEGVLPDVIAEEGMEEIAVPLAGPWIEPYPDFTARRRTHPMLFDYPCLDTMTMEVKAPEGYQPTAAPEPQVIDNPFGEYALTVTATAGGYRVERTLRLPHLSLPGDRLPGLRRFLKLVRKADGAKLLFRPAGGGA